MATACIVYLTSDDCGLDATIMRLKADGYEVQLCGVKAGTGAGIIAGDFSALSAEQQKMVSEADIVVVLISECTAESSEAGTAIGCALNANVPLFGVWATGMEGSGIPPGLIDYADDVVPLEDACFPVGGDGSSPKWEGPDGKPAEVTSTAYQKKC